MKRFVPIACALALCACGRFSYESRNTAHDSGTPSDAAFDANTRDASADTMMDAGTDATTDATFDAALLDLGDDDLGIDLGSDAGPPASVIIAPTSGLETNELGMSDTFTVVLGSAPTSDVIVQLASSDLLEVNVAPTSLTFTPANWASEQIVTVTGVADDGPDGNKAFTIITDPCVSVDGDYAGIDPDDISGINFDDATPGILAQPTTGLVTTEAGGSATFTVVLLSQPSTSVGIPLVSSDETEGTVSDAMAVFTSENWNIPQEITVTGADDFDHDGDVAYDIVVGPAMGDADYEALPASTVNATNTDDEVPAFTAIAATGLTGEDGTNDTISVVLASQPTASVTVSVTSTDTTEGTVSPSVLSFTRTNWNMPHLVTVSGVDEMLADGNIDYEVVLAVVATADSDYAALAPLHVAYTNVDDDTVGVTVNPSTGLTTTESGGAASFTIALNTRPTANVTIALSSDTPSEGTVSPSSVTFTMFSYGPRTITVTGVDDSISDGARVYHIVTAPAMSADPSYNGLDAIDATVTNTDNDVPSVIVTPVAGLATTESGGTASFNVRLGSQPSADVTFSLASSNTAEGTISLTSLTFTSANWMTAQNVVITGVNDSLIDGSVAYSIVTGAVTSADMSYSGMSVADVSVTNLDNDVAAVVVTPSSGLFTTENGGTAMFSVVLSATPSASVSLTLASSDLTEGTIVTSALTFTTGNWNIPQTVVITGVDDGITDGNIAYTIITSVASSADSRFNGLSVSDVSVTNTDNDIAGVTVTPTSGLVTSESGSSVTFTIVLNSLPAADVSITLTSSNTREGIVFPSSVTFTPSNWSMPQTVTVYGAADLLQFADGPQPYTIITSATSSSSPAYNGLTVADVSVTNTDINAVQVFVSPISGLTTTENGGTAQFQIWLGSQPGVTSSVTLSSSNPAEGTVSPSYVDLTGSPRRQTITVTGVDDLSADGSQGFTIITSAVASPGSPYDGMTAPDITVTNLDNDTGDIFVSPSERLTVTEMGRTASFNVVLSRMPSADVTIALSSSDAGEGTVAPAMLTFTSGNWNTPQSVTVTGVADSVLDSDQLFSIITAPASSADSSFNGQDAPNVSLYNIDVESQRCISCNGTDYGPTVGSLGTNNAGNVSTDGRYVSFTSAVALIPADTRPGNDVYVRDRLTNTLSIASLTNAGTAPNFAAHNGGTMTPDGRYVLFRSQASDIVAGDTNNNIDEFVRDRMLNTTVRASVSSTGANLPLGVSGASAISADGRYVVFMSFDTTVVPGDTNGRHDIFLRDLVMNTTTVQSVSESGGWLTDDSSSPNISDDGRYVVFQTRSAAVAADTNGCSDVYRRDRMLNVTTIVSWPTHTSCHVGSYGSSMSGDGRYIAFTSDAVGVYPGDTNSHADIFVRDMVLGTYVRVSEATSGTSSNDASRTPSISADGSRVVFVSEASNLVADDTNTIADAFMHDITTGTTTLISRSFITGEPQNGRPAFNFIVSISRDGSGAAITSQGTNMLPEIFARPGEDALYYVNLP